MRTVSGARAIVKRILFQEAYFNQHTCTTCAACIKCAWSQIWPVAVPGSEYLRHTIEVSCFFSFFSFFRYLLWSVDSYTNEVVKILKIGVHSKRYMKNGRVAAGAGFGFPYICGVVCRGRKWQKSV